MAFYEPEGFEPERSVGYLAKRVFQLSRNRLEPAFADEQVNFVQWTALVAIVFGQGTTAASISRHLCHDGGATTRVLDTLEQKGFIERSRDANDRRIVNLAVTDAGKDVAMRCRAKAVEQWNEVLVDWDAADVERLIGYLARLRDRMEQDA